MQKLRAHKSESQCKHVTRQEVWKLLLRANTTPYSSLPLSFLKAQKFFKITREWLTAETCYYGRKVNLTNTDTYQESWRILYYCYLACLCQHIPETNSTLPIKWLTTLILFPAFQTLTSHINFLILMTQCAGLANLTGSTQSSQPKDSWFNLQSLMILAVSCSV